MKLYNITLFTLSLHSLNYEQFSIFVFSKQCHILLKLATTCDYLCLLFSTNLYAINWDNEFRYNYGLLKDTRRSSDRSFKMRCQIASLLYAWEQVHISFVVALFIQWRTLCDGIIAYSIPIQHNDVINFHDSTLHKLICQIQISYVYSYCFH